MKKITLLFATLALAAASAKSFDLSLYSPSVVAGTELQPGDYKLNLTGTKMVLKRGSAVVETDVRIESTGQKFNRSSVKYRDSNGRMDVLEIRLRGTDMMLVVPAPTGSTAGSR
jgi:hypothetical protein